MTMMYILAAWFVLSIVVAFALGRMLGYASSYLVPDRGSQPGDADSDTGKKKPAAI